MMGISHGLILLFLWQYTSAEFEAWDSVTVNTCKNRMELECPSKDHDLVVRNATYRPGHCSCGRCNRGSLLPYSAMKDVQAKCPGGSSSCTAPINPYPALKCSCLDKFLDVEYRCIKRDQYQSTCGNQGRFTCRQHAHLTNHQYPDKLNATHCSVTFLVGEKHYITLAPWKMQVPVGWESRFCNYTTCHTLEYEKVTTYELIGDSFIKIYDPKNPQSEVYMEFMFHIEYEVREVVVAPRVRYDGTKYSPKYVGVLKEERKPNILAVVIGTLSSIVLSGMAIAALLICRKRYVEQQAEDRKILAETEENMYFSDKYQKRKTSVTTDTNSTVSSALEPDE